MQQTSPNMSVKVTSRTAGGIVLSDVVPKFSTEISMIKEIVKLRILAQ